MEQAKIQNSKKAGNVHDENKMKRITQMPQREKLGIKKQQQNNTGETDNLNLPK